MNGTNAEIQQLLFDEFGLDSLEYDSPIFSASLLDSMDVLRLILALEKRYSIPISPFEVTIEMFDSISDIADIVSRGLLKA